MKNLDKNNLSLRIAYIFESILAMVVLIAVFLGTIDVLRMIWKAYIVEFQTPVQYSQLNDLLGQILLLVIGVELVVMLSLHLPGALIEVLLYAIARKMLLLPKSEGMADVLIGVIAIAGIFAIRKYLVSNDNSNINVTSIHYEECEEGQSCEECEACREKKLQAEKLKH
ncbi:phosphate-starvation-inducible PsiE family protein [Romboutsia lituseburensis]|uniref:phosphate-starvation-inducible PsiE family protein n=1 Tax=Romboutsia lituseburensis TaxID=1537 RepID=UPI00215A63C7|nr:phosphate-starvation-inducible PsiE family protein [Romboutsia lituseburensis]MCR8745492.1 phosphate-starvation-inducible PsiE family protein [Romboutsia lituseburensis]